MQVYLRKKFSLSNEVKLNNPLEIRFSGNIFIGDGTYINSGRFLTGSHSKIVIGNNCAIGHNVTVSAISHDLENPTGPNLEHVEANVYIGDNVWIGSNVFIKHGVTLGNKVVIGANSVVTKDFENNSIIAGIPARQLKSKVN